jgi:LPS-assembly lipoprotein
MSFRALIQVLVISALVSGCGFHLRGSLPLPDQLSVIAVSTSDQDVKEEMVNALEASGAQVVADPAGARSLLDMYEVKFTRTVRTINTRGKVTGYILRYDVSYRVVNEAGDELRDSTLALQRDYNFDPNQVLQAEEEEEALREDMIEELTQRIMRQLVTIG